MPKFEVGTTFKKEFPPHGLFTGTISSYHKETGWYHVVYEDGDEEDLEESEIHMLLRFNSKPNKQQQKETTTAKTTAATNKKTGDLRSFFRPNKKARTTTTSANKSNNNNSDDDDESDKKPAAIDDNKDTSPSRRVGVGRRAATRKRVSYKEVSDNDQNSDDDEEEESSAVEDEDEEDFDDEDNSSDDDIVVFVDDDDLFEEQPTRKKTSKKNKTSGTTTKEKNKAKNGGKKKMYEMFQPMNAPTYPNLSLDEIHKTKDYLDPGGMEATDDIISMLVGEQVSKLGSLLQRSLKNDKSEILGSSSNPLLLGTACSGTDAPALALTLIQEQIDQRLPKLQSNDNDESTQGSKLHFDHTFSWLVHYSGERSLNCCFCSCSYFRIVFKKNKII